METINEIIPFAKEMLHQRPSRSMLKIYMLGSTLAVLGAIGGLVETLLLPFAEQDTVEDVPAELITEKQRKERKLVVKSSCTSLDQSEAVDLQQTGMMEAKAKYLVPARRRSSSNRLHAS